MNDTDSNKGTYTAEEVIELLKISSPTLYRWRKAGKIKFVTYGNGFYRYPKEEIDRIAREGL